MPSINDEITCIVSHPKGGCTGRAEVFLPHYTSIRQVIRLLIKEINLIFLVLLLKRGQ